MPDTRNVIIEYPITLPPSVQNPQGRIAGERYAVRDAATAAALHPDAVILGYEGASDLRVGIVTADYLNTRLEAIEADGWVASHTTAPPSEIVLTSVSRSVSPVSTELIPAQANRVGLLLANTGPVVLYVKAGTPATTADTVLAPGSIDETTFASTTTYVNAITASGTGTVYVRSVGQ